MIMYQASTILRNTRLDREFTLEEISKKIKIPKKYLEALENGDCKSYPQEPYCSLFVRDYAQFLGLNSHEILSIFRRDYLQDQKKSVPSRLNSYGITPQLTFSVGVIVLILIFSGYLLNEYLKFNRPPSLRVEWPANVSQNSQIYLSGITDPESTIRVNQDLVVVDSTGKFSKTIPVTSTETKIIVESKSPAGKTTVEQKTLTAN